jgi:hypothetical protein
VLQIAEESKEPDSMPRLPALPFMSFWFDFSLLLLSSPGSSFFLDAGAGTGA